MSQITNQSICVIGIITAIVVIPRYLRLPHSLELLYHDKIGQLLLLVLAQKKLIKSLESHLDAVYIINDNNNEWF